MGKRILILKIKVTSIKMETFLYKHTCHIKAQSLDKHPFQFYQRSQQFTPGSNLGGF